jgi:Xaa-Pro aminopeptidase
VWAARTVKSAWELERTGRAADALVALFAAAPGALRPGRAEVEVMHELDGVLRRHGHEGTVRTRGDSDPQPLGEVLSGPSGAVPGGAEVPLCGPGTSPAQGRGPGWRALRRGDAVVVDFAATVEGYQADAARTFFLGAADARLLEAYAVCRRALREAETLLRPGVPASAAYERGLEVAREAGFGEHWMGAGPTPVRFVGHSLGLELNEPPYLARGWEEPFAAGNVVAVEPKLVFPGVAAVGLENTYVVQSDGPPRCLTPIDEDALVVPA